MVNLKRLYELQLTKPVSSDGLFEDMAGILGSLPEMENEVLCYMLQIIFSTFNNRYACCHKEFLNTSFSLYIEFIIDFVKHLKKLDFDKLFQTSLFALPY